MKLTITVVSLLCLLCLPPLMSVQLTPTLTAQAAPVPIIELDAKAMAAGDPWVRIDLGDGIMRALPNVTAINMSPRTRKPGSLVVLVSLEADKVRLLDPDGGTAVLKVVHAHKMQVQLGDGLQPAIALPTDLDDLPDWALPDGPQWDGAFLKWARVYVPGLDAAEGAGIEDGQERIKTAFLYLSDHATPAGAPASLYRTMWMAEALRLGWHVTAKAEPL